MANVLGMERPHALLRREILHFDDSKVLSKGRRIVDLWHDDCKSDILRDKRELKVIPLSLHRDCQRKTLTQQCCFKHGASATAVRVQYPGSRRNILET